MSSATTAPDGPSSISRLFSGTFLKTLEMTMLQRLMPSMNTSNLS
ncbi:hypothetical protein NC651_007955 [Populus alba x Populus x berolinensis]|nr:hypothetical protein NC651_007955 [Populus alba x Populus x berolinensis]